VTVRSGELSFGDCPARVSRQDSSTTAPAGAPL
jgi:hypothetical protein